MPFRFLLCGVVFLSGCTTLSELYLQTEELALNSRLLSYGSASRSSRWVLSRESEFYVARNSELTTLNTANSDALTNVIQQAIRASFPQSQVAMLPETLAQARLKADSIGADFLVFPSIIVWNDKIGGWSELYSTLRYDSNGQIVSKFGLDKAQVQIIIVHAATGSVFDVIKLQASSGVLTLYGDSPDSILLPELKSVFADLVAIAG